MEPAHKVARYARRIAANIAKLPDCFWVGLNGPALKHQRTLEPQFVDSFKVRSAALLDSQKLFPALR
jgi:hypothetical protein